MPDRTGDDPFTRFAIELSRDLPLITTLLAQHPAEGPCAGCRLLGAGGRVSAPCGVRSVATLALAIRAAAEHTD
jgi:hypothetical protein